MAKIEKLTPEQSEFLPQFREEWLRVGLSTEPVDRARSTEAVKALYAAGGLDEPVVLHFDSPAQCCIAIALLRNANLWANLGDNLWANLGDNLRANLRDNLRANLWGSLRDNLGDNLWDNLWANLWDSLGDNLWANLGDNLGANLRDNLGDNLWANLRANLRADLGDNLRASLWANLGDNLWDNLRDNLGDNLWANLRDNLGANLWADLGVNLRADLGDNLRDNLWDNLRDNLGDNLWANLRDNLGANLWADLGVNLRDNLRADLYVDTWFWGGQDAPWLAFYEFGREIGVQYQKGAHFDAYLEYARSSGWLYAYKGVAFVSDRPSVIIKDDARRLHCETGPALAFRDGYALHMWHGTPVPANWIEDKAGVSPQDILGHQDGNVRAAGIAILGWPRLIAELDAKVIDRHPEGDAGGELLAFPKSRIEPSARGTMKLLRAACPRNGQIAFRVPDDIKTAHAAQAWARGLPPEIFQLPAIRT